MTLPQLLRPARGRLARERGGSGARLQPRAASLRRRSRWLLSPPMPRHSSLRSAPGRPLAVARAFTASGGRDSRRV